MTCASEASSALYHLPRLSRPALMAGASDRYRSCLAICSQRVCSHSSRPTVLVTVAWVSLEKICCASATSCSVVGLDWHKGLISMTMDGAHTNLQRLMDQLQLCSFCIRNLKLLVVAAIGEFGDTVAAICKIDEVLNSLEQTVTSTRWEMSHLRIPAAVEGVARSCCLLMTIVCDTT